MRTYLQNQQQQKISWYQSPKSLVTNQIFLQQIIMKDNQSVINIIIRNGHSHQLSNYISPFIKWISEKVIFQSLGGEKNIASHFYTWMWWWSYKRIILVFVWSERYSLLTEFLIENRELLQKTNKDKIIMAIIKAIEMNAVIFVYNKCTVFSHCRCQRQKFRQSRAWNWVFRFIKQIIVLFETF